MNIIVNNKTISILLLVLFLLLILIIINKGNNIENFANDPNPWTTPKDELAQSKAGLNNVQKTEVQNMINSLTKSELQSLIRSQSPLLVGPPGQIGPQGPSGGTYVATGRLINKSGSYGPNDKQLLVPRYAVTRTEGTSKDSSLAFMDTASPFASAQNWHLDVNENLINRFDGNCLTMDASQEKLFIEKCDKSNGNQKWSWDSSNRIFSTTASTDTKLKCIGLTQPENNVMTTNIPGCEGENCMNDVSRRYLKVKDCDVNNVHEDEMWIFM